MDKEKRDNMITGIQVFDVPFHWVNDGEKRLDASFYAQDVIAARIVLDKVAAKVKIANLKDIVEDIFMPALKITIPFCDNGQEYLTQSEVEFFLPRARKRLNINKIDDPERWKVKSGFLLISQSGTIGRVTMATKYLEKFVISPNLIRVVAEENLRGYIYAFLSSWFGQALIKSLQYGITVKHILPHHLYNIPIPRIQDLEKEINQKILEAHKLREEAQELLLKAEEMIYSELGLPRIDEDDIEYFGGEIGRIIKAFEIKASELDYRLDASYHEPILNLIKENLKNKEKEGTFQLKRLGDVSNLFDLPTYKRIYVKSDEGYPILSGTHLRQLKLYDLKYISGRSFYKKGKSVLDKYKVKEGWILTTERGTTGVSALVTKCWDGWLASHNILRVIPQNVNPGYLLAYLNTEYAQYQLKSKELGAVVKVLDPKDMENILVPIPKDKTLEDKIGSLVIDAYNKKDLANQIEENAIKYLEEILKKIAEEAK
jgi:type I restriction enzyme, S subunit